MTASTVARVAATLLFGSGACRTPQLTPNSGQRQSAEASPTMPTAAVTECERFGSALAERIAALPESIRPPALPPVHFPGFGNYYHPEAPLGAGILRNAVPGVEGVVLPWPCGVVLPLYDAPTGRLWGWFIGGFLARRDRTWLWPLNSLPTIQTGQSENALLVYEVRPDGWLRFRYYFPGSNTGDGTAWTHVSRLDDGAVPLRLVPWEEFIGRSPGPFVFRDRQRRAIYADPDTASAVVTWPDGNYGLNPLEVRGSWMRVRLQRPANECSRATGEEFKVDSGWIRWRDDRLGTLLWVEAWDC